MTTSPGAVAFVVLSSLFLVTHDSAVVPARAAEPEEAHADGPREAERWRSLTLKDERGSIPHDAVMRAKAQMEALRAEGTAGGLDSTKWTELGPGNVGGRVRSLGIHPSTLNLFAGSVSGGLWKTTTTGTSWSKVDDLMTNLAITSIVYPNPNPSILYAATGEGFNNIDAVRGAGIFKSTDGGTTWAQLPSTATPDFYWVNRLAISNNGNIVLAATGSGMQRSVDGGASWAKVYAPANGSCLDVKWHGFDNTLAVASVRVWDPVTATGYHTAIYTTNGGLAWVEANGLHTAGRDDRVELHWMYFYNRGSVPGCIYALKAIGATTSLYRSFNGGALYTLVSQPAGVLGNQGWYDNALWVDPTDDNAFVGDDRIVIGGIDLWRSTDGGATPFTKISDWNNAPLSPHADQHVIAAHPRYDAKTNFTVYVANDGGVWRTDNIYTASTTSGWVNLNNQLPITQFYGASRHAPSGTIIGGSQDNGTGRYTSNPNAWSRMFGGDGGFCASDPGDGNYHYGEYVFLRIYRSVDGGGTASYIWNGIADANNMATANFIAPFVLDPSSSNTLLGGGLSLWRSTNAKAAAPAWASIKASVGSLISAIAVAPGNPNVIWVGHNDGEVYYTSNGTAAAPVWTRRDTTVPALPDRYVTRITIDRANASRVFVCLGGYAADNLWQTTNAGAAWVAATGLPSAPVRDVEIHEAKSDVLYAATEVGLLVSENNGVAWTSTATPAKVSVEEMFWSGHQLYLVTHGRGIFRQSPYPPPGAFDVGLACKYGGPVTGPALTCGSPLLGATLSWTASGLAYPGTAVLYLSNVPAAPYQLSPGCFVQIDLTAAVDFGTRSASATGTAGWTFPVPDAPALAGVVLMTQVAELAGGALYLSNGRRIVLGY